MTLRHILVAVKDPDARWSPAVAKAAQIARSAGAGIELLHVVDTRMYVGALDTFESQVSEFEAEKTAPFKEKLELLAQRVRRHGIVVSTAAVLDHPVYEAILRHAELGGADLIVTDCHDGANLAPSLVHLTDWELARLSPVPVLIVRKRRLYHRPGVLCAVDPGHAHSKPVGLEPRILATGGEICHALRGALHAVYAYFSIPPGAEVSTATTPGTAMKMDAVAAADAQVAFNHSLRSTTAGVREDRRHLVGGSPAEAIANVVGRTGVDILVIGSVSRSGLKRLIVGNTAEKLLYRLPCDILVVKPENFDNRVSTESQGARVIVTPACG